MVNQLLLAFQFALTLLVIDAQALVLDLNLVEQLLNLSEVLRAVLLCEGLTQRDNFLL